MKKRILVTLFAVCLVVCALSITALAAEPAPVYVAQIGETKFESIQAAVEAAEDEDTIVVLKSHEVDCSSTVINSGGYSALVNVAEKKVTIDLNGKIITVKPSAAQLANAKNEMLLGVFAVDTNGSLTLKDSGGSGSVVITAGDADVYSLAICYGDGGKLNIESGSYSLDYSTNGLIYGQYDEVVTVNGGTFHMGNVGTLSNGSPWIFCAKGQNERNIIVNGGTFNADVVHQFYPFEVAAPKERALLNNGDGTWTMVDAVAYVNEQEWSSRWYTNYVGYASLEEAVAALEAPKTRSGQTSKQEYITIIKDCTVNSLITIDKEISIYCNADVPGATIKWGDASDTAIFDVTNTGTLIIDPIFNTNYKEKEPADGEPPISDTRATPAKLTFAQDVTEWCVDGYVAVENDAGLYEVVEGWKVSYYVDGDDTPVYIEGVITGGKAKGYIHVVEAVEQGEEDNAIFKWYKEAEVQPIVFPLDIVEDTPLHGTLVPAVIVDFETGEGSEVSRQVIEADAENGVEVTEPSAPTKENSTFMGWYADEGLTIEFDFDAAIRDSADIYAKWIDDSVVRFETNGGGVLADVYVPYGEKLEKPRPDPTKTGYSFAGWYVDAELTEEYDFDAEIAEESDFTLYAKWDEVVYVPAYSIDAPEGVKLSPANAWPGETVTVTIEDADMDGVRILDSKGNLIRVNGSDGVFKFVMPYGDVKVEPFALPFDDVTENDYFHDAVIWALANGITEGTSDTAFSPNADCTRAQMVTFLWRAAGCPEPTVTESSFTDVDMDSYYAKAVLWAVQNGITEGTGEGLFSPDAECSRAQMAVFLSRMTGGKAQGEDFAFSDVDGSAYYANAVQWAAETGITLGTGDGLFSPDAACSRAQMVTFLLRCFNK